MADFSLDDQEYIELNKLLKLLNFVGTGGEAMIRIDNGEVTVNGTTEKRRRKKLRIGDKVKFMDEMISIVK